MRTASSCVRPIAVAAALVLLAACATGPADPVGADSTPADPEALLADADAALERNELPEAARAYRRAAEASEDEAVAQQATELATLRAESERQRALFNDMCGTAKRALKDLGKANDEIERMRAALREIDHARYTGRNTINPDNAFEHAIALNEKLITVMDIARAALPQEKPND